MHSEKLYHQLKELSDRLGIRIDEKSFRNVGITVESGLCKIKGEGRFIMDRNRTISEKNQILATCLSRFPLDDIYIVPALREYIEKASTIKKPGEN